MALTHGRPHPSRSDADELVVIDSRIAVERLFEERTRLGLSLLDWEDFSGVSTNSAYSWRSGIHEPTLGNFVALAAVTGFEVILKKRKAE